MGHFLQSAIYETFLIFNNGQWNGEQRKVGAVYIKAKKGFVTKIKGPGNYQNYHIIYNTKNTRSTKF